MFETQAHSFAQQARLAVTLAWVAGYTNAVSILALGTVTSHMSGAASNLGKAIAEHDWTLFGLEAYLIGGFALGAAISGMAMEFGRRRGWESMYVLPMGIEAALLALIALGLEYFQFRAEMMGDLRYVFIALATAAMGLQNATITRISSGVVRTTHVTGVLTDLGTEFVTFGYFVRDAAWERLHGRSTLGVFVREARKHQSSRRLALLGSIIGSFVVGAALGAVLYEHLPRWSMFPPVLFLMWVIFQDVHRPIAEIATADVVSTQDVDLPESVGVYVIRHDARRRGVPRMPDLQAWTDRLPQVVRVAVLDLAALRVLDDDSLTELASAMERLRNQRRHLIVSGVTPQQYLRLREIGAEDVIGPESIVPDLEFALVRAMLLSAGDRVA